MSKKAKRRDLRMPAPRAPFANLVSQAARWAGPIAIALAGIGMTIWTWQTWADVLVDFGREVYVPWQLTEGKALYRDIAYFNGPLSPYLNSIWFRLFGISILTLAICNLAILAVLICLMYWILTQVAGRLGATAACLLLLLVFSFGQLLHIANFNFVCPYAHEMTHGIVLAVAAIFFLGVYLRRRQVLHIAGAGVALGLAFLTKPEVFAAAALSVVCGLGLTLWTERPSARRLSILLGSFTAAALLPSVAAFALLQMNLEAGEAWRGLLGGWPHAFNAELSAQTYYRDVLKTLALGENLIVIVKAIGLYCFFFLPLAGLAFVLRKLGAYRAWIAAALFFFLLLVPQFQRLVWSNLVRPLPLFMVVLAAVCLALLFKPGLDREEQDRMILRVTLALFALALLAKMIFKVRVAHYGFGLSMPATLLLVVSIVDWIPRIITRKGGYGALFRAGSLALLVLASQGFLGSFERWFRQKNYLVGSGADLIRADERGYFVAPALDEIGRVVAPNDSLVVVPEGVMLNYLSRRVNPTPYLNFMPPELIMFGEGNILAAFKAHPPDYVAVAHKQTEEYGLPYFGKDYGQRIHAWIMENYAQVGLWGEPPLQSSAFGVLLLKRKSLE
jgi:Dolichyl-phosphate-mannose-protein mannosyltransferase